MIVDVSADVLCATGFVDRVRDTLRRRGMSSDALCLAVDGVEVARNEVTARAALERLHAFGVRIARDNVGAPGSPLTYFDGWPITLVRLDATLVAAIDDPGHRHLIVLVCDAANAAGRVTIAPAVHTATQAAALVGIGIDLLHGPPHHRRRGTGAVQDRRRRSRRGGPGRWRRLRTTPQVGHISLRPVRGVGDEIVDFEWSSIDPHAGRLDRTTRRCARGPHNPDVHPRLREPSDVRPVRDGHGVGCDVDGGSRADTRRHRLRVRDRGGAER